MKPTKAGMKKYLDIAAMLKPMLAGFEGFIRAERFSSLNEEGKLLSMNVWTDEAAVERWLTPIDILKGRVDNAVYQSLSVTNGQHFVGSR